MTELPRDGDPTEWLVRDTCCRLSRETGLSLAPRQVFEAGFRGWALSYDQQADEGLSFTINLASTVRHSEAVFRPSRFAGPLVREIAKHLAEDPSEWQQQLSVADSQGLQVTVSADSEVLLAPDRLGESEFRSLEIECLARNPSRDSSGRHAGLQLATRTVLALVLSGLEVSSTGEDEDLTEGAVVRVEVNKYERNPVARMRCIEHYGDRCWVCDVSFGDLYGDIGTGFIHVHHRVLVSDMKGEPYVVDPIRDLVPLCPNCHSMIHRRRPPYEPAELRSHMGLPDKDSLPSVSRP
jgi:5-methylcytosine-specific restriction protein A